MEIKNYFMIKFRLSVWLTPVFPFHFLDNISKGTFQDTFTGFLAESEPIKMRFSKLIKGP